MYVLLIPSYFSRMSPQISLPSSVVTWKELALTMKQGYVVKSVKHLQPGINSVDGIRSNLEYYVACLQQGMYPVFPE